MAFVVALRGDLATSRLTDECAALPAEPRNRSYAVTKRQIAGDASVGASLVLQGEYNARNRHSSAGRVRHRAGRYVADLAAPAKGEVIGQAAHLNPGVEQVYWRRYHWHLWRHRYHRRWW